MDKKQVAGLNNQSTPIELSIDLLNERMNTVLGKNAATQPAAKEKKKKETDKPQEPEIVKEEIETENFIKDYDPYEFLIGATIELEHTSDVIEAMRIASDHLDEVPDYYSKLLTYVEPEEDPIEDLKQKQEEPVESVEELKDTETEIKEYQTPGGSNINVGRMIKNMSRMKMPKFDSRRNLADRFKVMFKMRSPKDDMNAALQSRESYNIVGRFEDEKQANDALRALLNRKRDAQLLKDKNGINIVIVKE
jgi:prefoldin subunit 5